MKVLMKVTAVMLVAVLMISTTITAYAGQLPEKQKEVEISAEEESVLDGDINEAEDQSENEIADDTDSEDLPEDQEEIEIPVEDQTEEEIEDDSDIDDEDFSYDDTEYEESESEDDNELPEETMLEDGADIVMPWTLLQNKINAARDGDTIVLDQDYTAVKGDTMLVIEDKDITLDLNGHTLDRNLDAADADGHAIIVRSNAILYLTSNSDKKAMITGGFANNGGAINNKGTLYVDNVVFKDNHASHTDGKTIGRGGAIYNEGTLTMRGCIIGGDESNSASDGGAIYNNTRGDIFLKDVTISNNVSVNHSGGGIDNYGKVLLEDCELSLNRSNSVNAGAIWNGENGEVTIYGCSIKGNTAKNGSGGGIFNKGTMFLKGRPEYPCTVSENSAFESGGIYNEETGILNIEDISVHKNESGYYGGGITNCGVMNIEDISVTENKAESYGGGITEAGTLNVKGRIEIKNNISSNGYHNLALLGDKVLNVTGRISDDSEIRLWGMNVPRPLTSGWKEKSGITSQEKIRDTVIFDVEHSPYLYDDGELNVLVKYLDRKWDGNKVAEEEKMIPESPHRIPAGGGNLSDKRWYAVCENEKINQILIVPEEKTANIILMDGRTLTTTKGFYVPAANHGKAKATLNIYGQKDDNGGLKASAIEYVPAIGGNQKSGHGDINFHGGKIVATGGDYGAGIGTGDENDYSCGTISIYGGNITAQGGQDAAGIGGGNEDLAGKINIYGGTVNATGGFNGAGIGGGDDSEYNDITIYGGDITAKSGCYAAGIGEGCSAESTGNHTITIKGGTINASSKDDGAGIGGGAGNNSGCKIIIDGGRVTAESGDIGAGIGSGAYEAIYGGGDFSGSITINNGDVHAYARNGEREEGRRAYNYLGGAAIGTGMHGDVKSGATITINGGNVEAVASYGGAAIGASTHKTWVADGDCNGTVRINGGNVSLCLQDVVLKDKQDDNVHIIGHGFGGSKDGTLFIDSSMKVWFEGKDPVPQNKRSDTCHSFSNQWLHIGVR